MRILSITTGHPILDDRIFYREAISLSRAGHEVTIMARGEGEATIKDGVNLLPLGRLPPDPISASSVMLREAEMLRPEVVQCHEPESLPAAARIRRNLGSLMVYDAHEDYLALAKAHRSPSPRSWIAAGRTLVYERRFCSLADRIITATQSLARRYSDYGGTATAVYNYPRLDIFHPRFEAALADRYRGRDLIVYAGGLGRWRRAPVMVESVRAVAREEPQVLLLVMSHHDLNGLAHGAGADQHLEYLGWVEHTNLAAYHSLARAGISLLEPSPPMKVAVPTKMFEYMACAVPPIVTDLPETARVLKGESAGLLLSRSDADELASALGTVVHDRRWAAQMGKRALRLVRKRYNWAVSERALLELYDDLAKRSAPPH